ncbi:MAG: hypothetical protein GY751_18715 [Bacteroidetes bacterium]|nr:hypothetical protein [Bacteroidota bacterium]
MRLSISRVKFYLTTVLIFSWLMTMVGTTLCQDAYTNLFSTIVNDITEQPVIDAHVIIHGSAGDFYGISDHRGRLVIEQIPPGDYTVTISHINYQHFVLSISIITDRNMEFRLKQAAYELDAFEVVANEKITQANDMSLVSTNTFTIKLANKFPAVLEDPGRIATLYPGVSGGLSDATNEIIVRGNSPRGNTWRIEGIDVVSPNHFSKEGDTGGSISIIGSNLMDKSDILTTAYPAQYGNAFGGFFDIHFKEGSRDTWSLKTKVSLIGLEGFAEGPMGEKASFLVNGRYSTFALIEKMGINLRGIDTPEFYDVNYKVHFDAGEKAKINFFGVNGWSEVGENKMGKDSLGNNYLKRKDQIVYDHILNGVNYQQRINPKTILDISGAILKSRSSRLDYARDDTGPFLILKDKSYDNLYLKGHAQVRNKWKSGVLQTGFIFSHNVFDLKEAKNKDLDTLVGLKEKLRETGKTQYCQFYSSIKWEPSSHLVLTGGLHSLFFAFNRNLSVEPRFALRWAPSSNHSLSVGAGLYSKLDNMVTYFARTTDTLGNTYRLNRNLEMTKSVQSVISYRYQPIEIFDVIVEAYYQFLYNVAISGDTSNSKLNLYSSINAKSLIDHGNLVSEGKAYNYGMDLSATLTTPNRWLAKFNLSLFDSQYLAADGVVRRTRWSHNISSNIIFGKEFLLGSQKNGSFRVGANLVLSGGRRFPVIDEEASLSAGSKIYDEELSFSLRGPMYYRLDVMFSYTLTKPKFEWNIRIDVQNVTDNTTLVEQDFDPVSGITEDVRGQIFPVLTTGFDLQWARRSDNKRTKIRD